MLSNVYSLAKFRFDTAENEPSTNLQTFEISNVGAEPIDLETDYGEGPSAAVVNLRPARQLAVLKHPRPRAALYAPQRARPAEAERPRAAPYAPAARPVRRLGSLASFAIC